MQRILLGVLAAILTLPLIRVGIDTFTPDPSVDTGTPAWKAREALIARAKVFLDQPSVDPHPLDPATVPECRYVPKRVKATTPKFDCRFPDGHVIKVKYGHTPEKHGEVAATRLLAALGFGADHVTMLPKLRCAGCPWFPFQMRRIAESFFAVPLLEALTSERQVREFEWVAAERKLTGRAIEIGAHEGWDWRELPLVDPAKGGATRAELDALRLIAIFLGHWDNKAANQRLVCEEGEGGDDPAAPCRHPFLMLQDVGATFGPTKVEFEEWRRRPIWADAGTCGVSLQDMPYHGGNFTPIRISEGGRALLAMKLVSLGEDRIRAIFEAARFPDPETGAVPGDVAGWVRAFQDKVGQIANRPACPSLSD